MQVRMLIGSDGTEFPSYVITADATYAQITAAAECFDLEHPDLADDPNVGWRSFDTEDRPGLVPFTFVEG